MDNRPCDLKQSIKHGACLLIEAVGKLKIRIMNPLIKKISIQGLFNILKGLGHVVIETIESREDAEGVIQCNLDDGLLDEIELLIELEGE